MPTQRQARTGVQPQVQATGDRGRAIFNSLKSNPAYKNKLIQPSFLRAEIVLKNGKANYEFSLQKDSNSDSITERKLDRNDKFLMSQMHLYLSHVVRGHEGAATLVTCERAFPVELTNQVSEGENNGPAGSSNSSIYEDLAVLYNGAISLTVGQTKFLEGIDTLAFRHESEFRHTMSQGALVTGFQSKNGALAITPNMLLDGALKTSVQLNIPVTNALKIEGDSVVKTVWNAFQNQNVSTQYPCDHKVVLFLRGFLITNK